MVQRVFYFSLKKMLYRAQDKRGFRVITRETKNREHCDVRKCN